MLDFSLWLLLFCSLVLLAVVRNPQIRLILESVDGGYFSRTSFGFGDVKLMVAILVGLLLALVMSSSKDVLEWNRGPFY